MRIDAVYTWVDGSRPDFQQALEQYAEHPEDRNPERYRDDLSLLKYSLRSLERYLPWIDEVHLFSARPQVPEWMDTGKVRVVHHDQLIPSEYLPTFNTRVIESYLHQVATEPDFLISIQDDWLFTRDVTLSDFLTEEGKIKVYGTFFGEASRSSVFEGDRFIPTAHIEHVPRLVDKALWGEMLEWMPHEVEKTRRNRFRTRGDLRMDRLYRSYLLCECKDRVVPVTYPESRKIHHFLPLSRDPRKQAAQLEKIRKKRPKFLCLNDGQGTEPNPEVTKLVHDFLEEMYPQPSKYEL